MASKEELKLQAEFRKAVEQSNLAVKDRVAILADASKLTNEELKNAIKLLAQEKKIVIEKKKRADEEEKIVKLLEDQTQSERDLIDLASTLKKDIIKNKKEFQGIGKSADGIVASLQKNVAEQIKIGKLTKAEGKEIIDTAKETANLASRFEELSNSSLAPVFQETQNLAADTADKIQGMFNKLPGGATLFNYLGGDKLKERLGDAVTKGFITAIQGGNGLEAFIAKLKTIPNIGLILGIGAVIAGVGILLSVFKDISKAAHDLSESAGITYTEAKRLNQEARAAQASFDNQLATFEDITAIQKELVEGLGSAALVSTEIAANIADTAKAFGVSAETAGAVTNALIAQGNTQEEVAKIQMEANAMAVKAGVNVAAVQQDIADNAAAAAEFIGGSGIELAKAAVEAAKLGVTLDQLVKTSDQLLDIESSLQKQFRAQALTGKSLNFDKARQLALEGDIIGAQKEMLKQAGSLEDFNSMNVVQRRALADAMGMEVGDLQKSLTLQKMRGKLTEEEIAAASGLNKSAAQLANMSADQIKKELAKKNAAEKTNAAFDTLKNDLTAALAPAAQAFADIFSALSPVIKLLGVALKIAFAPITLIGNLVKSILDNFSNLKDMIMGSGEGLSTMQKVLAAITGIAALYAGYQAAAAASQLAYNTYKAASLALEGASLSSIIAQGAALAGKAVSAIFSGFAMIPFGLGIPLAIAAVAGLIGLISSASSSAKQTGDLGIAPGGGPIVASPREGAIFQGTANDGVEMSPTAGVPGAGGGGGTAVIDSGQLTQMITALQGILTAVQSPPPVVIGDSQLAGISNNISARNSFKV